MGKKRKIIIIIIIINTFGAQERRGKKNRKKTPLHLTKFDEDKRTKHKRIYKEHNNTPSLNK